MGLGGSKEIEENVKAEKEAELKKQNEKRLAEEKKVKDEARKKVNAEAQRNRQEADQEVEEESRKGLATTRKLVADYNKQKDDSEKRLEEIKKEMKENVEKQQELIKKQGIDDVKEAMERLQMDNEKIVQEKELLALKMNQLYEFKQENVKNEKEEEKEMRKEESERMKKHKDEILEMTETVTDVELEGQKQLTELAGEQAESLKGILEKKEKLHSIQMSDALCLRKSQDIEQRHEIFRGNCKSLIRMQSSFSSLFGSEEPGLIETRDEINQGIAIFMAPELSLTLRALQRLKAALEEFSVDGSTEAEKFENLRGDVFELVAQLLTSIGTIVSNIQSYRNACVPQERTSIEPADPQLEEPRKTRLVSMTPSESEEFEVLTPGVKNKANPVIRKPDENASQRFNISELYNQTKDLMKQLSKEMLKFNVRACTVFDDQLAIQHTMATERLRMVEGGSTAAIESKPVIQETDEQQ